MTIDVTHVLIGLRVLRKRLDSTPTELVAFQLDGFIEAAVLAARTQSIGLSEALLLTTSALLREFAAHGVPRDKLIEAGGKAMESVYSPSHAIVH